MVDWVSFMQLKSLPRAGWVRIGIDNPESVAAHSWGLAMLCLEWAPKSETPLDIQRVLQIALVHDLPEVIAGDITPHDGVSTVEKHELERKAAQQMMPNHLYKLWEEYQDNQTPEAHFVHQMDKIDMAIQAIAYRDKKNTDEFIDSARRKLDTEHTVILDTIIAKYSS